MNASLNEIPYLMFVTLSCFAIRSLYASHICIIMGCIRTRARRTKCISICHEVAQSSVLSECVVGCACRTRWGHTTRVCRTGPQDRVWCVVLRVWCPQRLGRAMRTACDTSAACRRPRRSPSRSSAPGPMTPRCRPSQVPTHVREPTASYYRGRLRNTFYVLLVVTIH